MPDFTGSFSGSFEGNGSQLTNIDYYNLANLPTVITPFQKNSILANNSVRDNFVSNVKTRLNAEGVISSSAQLTAEFDIRYGNEEGDNLISGSAQIKSLLPSGVISGSSQLPIGLVSGSTQVKSLLPNGTISGSTQVTSVITDNYISASAAASGFSSGGETTELNEFTASIDSEVTALMAATSSYITSIPAGTISGSSQLPNGLISGSSQLPNGLVSGSAQIKSLLPSDVISGSSQLPSNIISSSAQITALGFSTSDSDSQTLTLTGQTLSISSGNSVSLAGIAGGGGSGGASIWNTGSQDPSSYTKLMTQNNLEVTGSVDIKGDFTVNGQSVFTQTSASDAGNALVVKGRIKVLEEQIGNYIASASIQVGNTQDTIDCGGFF